VVVPVVLVVVVQAGLSELPLRGVLPLVAGVAQEGARAVAVPVGVVRAVAVAQEVAQRFV